MPVNAICYDRLFKADLAGIGIMIFGLTLVGIWLGFHNWPTERYITTGVIGFTFFLNLCFQMTPCFTDNRYIIQRAIFYTVIILGTLCLAFVGSFYIATEIENT